MWLPSFACPECGDGLSGALCAKCGRTYPEHDGIWRFLTGARLAALDPFVRQYRAVREREGRRPLAAEYYRALPTVRDSDPHAAEWRIRRESYRNLLRRVFASAPQPVRVLDLGAGCGWLSHRLAELGHRVVAVDVIDDEADGLGVARHYDASFAAVQADFEHLPFAAEQFDVVVLNGSLHYAADVVATLGGGRRVLAPGGALVVMDSPMFSADADGRAMVRDQGHAVHGAGYLTFALLERTASALGLSAEFVPSRGSRSWRVRRQLAHVRLRRAPAAFGVWAARRPLPAEEHTTGGPA